MAKPECSYRRLNLQIHRKKVRNIRKAQQMKPTAIVVVIARRRTSFSITPKGCKIDQNGGQIRRVKMLTITKIGNNTPDATRRSGGNGPNVSRRATHRANAQIAIATQW